ncbi:MAG: aminoacyl-tRNA hydrolase [Desulfobulbaceae bacterium]|nr:MAG: aminoacyl-tRNA hydrolase [Desulfobulbaceae bacterium]
MSYLIVGLGNPGDKYQSNRHNIGFMFVDLLCERFNLQVKSSKWNAQMTQSVLWGVKVYLLKPQTYMNRSGSSVAGAAGFFDIPIDKIIVVHDDLDMHVGRVKLVQGGGSGGHNGIKSITQHLGDNDYYRLKIGIGRPGNSDAPEQMPVDKFVLSDFSSADQQIIDQRLPEVMDGLSQLLEGQRPQALSFLNSLK